MDNSPENQPSPEERTQLLHESRLLRNEAGEWKFGEPHNILLGMIIARETIIDSMKEAGVHPPVKEDDEMHGPIYDAYRSIAQQIEAMKEELGIETMPSLSQDDKDQL